jgi:hypothetical protein
MKNKMIKILLIFTIVLVLSTKNVNASTYSMNDSFNKGHNGTIWANIGYGVSPGGFHIYEYNVTANKDGINYPAFCLDPGAFGVNPLDVSAIFNEGEIGTHDNAWYQGLLSILKNGYRKNHQEGTAYIWSDVDGKMENLSISGENFYAATSIAIRTFTDAMAEGKGTYYTENINRAHVASSIFWSGYTSYDENGKPTTNYDSWYKAYFGEDTTDNHNTSDNRYAMTYDVVGPQIYGHLILLDQEQGRKSWWQTSNDFIEHERTNYRFYEKAGSELVYDYAYNLFRDALIAASHSYDETNTSNKVLELFSKGNISKNKDGDKTTFTSNDIYTVDMTNFDPSTVKIWNFNISSAYSKYITLSYTTSEDYTKDSNYSLLDSNIDLLSLKKENNKIYIKVSINITEDEVGDECSPADYSIKYNYTGIGSSDNGYLLDTTTAATATTQRYVIYVENDASSNSTGSMGGTFDVCGIYCSSTINVVKDCTELSSADIWENTWITDSTTTSSITASDNITGCILNKTDDAGNTFNLSKENGGVSTDNPYCQIYCKEDYGVLKFSGVQKTNSGRYFQIAGHLEGTKSCYTASAKNPITSAKNSIDIEKYNNDIAEASKQLVNAYNEYIFYKEASDIASTVTTSSDTYTGAAACTAADIAAKKCTTESSGCDSGTKSFTLYSKSWGFTMYDYSGNAHKVASGGTYTAPDGTVYVGTYSSGTVASCTTCESDCTGSDGTNMDSSHKTSMESAAEKLKSAQTNYENIIGKYRECTTDENLTENWQNVFNKDYMPDIYYSYSENYYKLYDASDYIMNRGVSTTETEIAYCTGTINKNYECSTETTNYNPTTTKSYLYCDTNGCKSQVENNISTARYVKKIAKNVAEYTTPVKFENIYTSGTISITDVQNADMGATVQSTDVNGLPVSLKTAKGVYTFDFKINKLGQLYNQGTSATPTLGRIVDTSNTEANTVIKKVNGSDTMLFNGDYICYYTVNCPECEIKCENKNGNKCEWCIGSNCCETGQNCTCPECEISCVNCIYDLSSLQINFRAISSTNINPNDRELGYNWNVTSTYGLIGEKADTTINEISSDGDKVYDETPILTVNMTPSVASDIRSYNKDNISKGGYANDSLTCYDYKSDDATSPNVFCFSDFLDEMSQNDSSAFEFVSSRLSVTDRKNGNTDTISKTLTDASRTNEGYWQIYTSATTYKVGNVDVVGGVSWK